MKRIGWMLILLFLLPLQANALEVRLSSDAIALSDTISVSVEGAEGKSCTYTLLQDRKEAFSGEPVFCYEGILRPREEGQYTLIVTCGGEEARAQFTVAQTLSLDGAPAPVARTQIRAEGRMGTVFAQGDMRTWQISSPGPWLAETSDDFITLYNTCGQHGDDVTFSVSPCEENRVGTILFRSGEETLTVEVKQVAELKNTEEEELSLIPAKADWIFVEGESHQVLSLSGSDAFFQVTASGEWTAQADADFLYLDQMDGGLLLYADENTEPAARTGSITLCCGTERTYIYVHQYPMALGADVHQVTLNMEEATAWQDTLLARVETSLDAHLLMVSLDETKEVFPASVFAREADDMLLWQVDIPLRNHGDSWLLFAAEDADGISGVKQWADVKVLPEDALPADDEAVLTQVGSRYSLQFVTTAHADTAILKDGNGREIAILSPGMGQVDFAGEGEERERYLSWNIPLDTSLQPQYVQVGEAAIPVVIRKELTPEDITLYSQTDGWWQDKKYSISNLEISGCAVFSLSHALQLLGYTGEDITPERLARTYASALMRDGSGTMNSTLVGRAGDDLGFKTRYELYKDRDTILHKAREGAVYSFSVVSGHIACVAGVTEDGDKCLIIDSAPSATFERKGDTPVYYLDEAGDYVEAHSPGDIPGVQYCIETNSYGCAVYYLDMSYVARRGVRLIQPQ